ncbi:uncharacterized protein LOC133849737 [Drosophila sulfurigaster albostrigata]|uniref:uncharacterized protein LOC133849737 n=1 Tax=Drosophila sulfurigaster albostrigata TaxID=89887 RepID=UPI002D21C2E5|nr:uncharacterized protein LOC133849737 [Drosophila sulfurigaster albostrigata]
MSDRNYICTYMSIDKVTTKGTHRIKQHRILSFGVIAFRGYKRHWWLENRRINMADNNETVSLTPPDARRIFLKELKRRIIKARSAQTVGWLEQHLENATDSVLAQIDDKLNTLNTFLLTSNSIITAAGNHRCIRAGLEMKRTSKI